MLHYRTQALCRVPVTLGKSPYTLGKAFTECNSRQRSLDKSGDGKGLFAECLLSGTRQRLCRVPVNHSAKKSCLTASIDGDGHFAERLTGGPRQSPPSLPSVTLGKGREALPSALLVALGKGREALSSALLVALGKASLPLPSAMAIALGKLPSFAKCLSDCTRHSWEICFFCIFFCLLHPHIHISHNHHIYITYHTTITYITQPSHIIHNHDKYHHKLSTSIT